jgi:hypothetical protein
LSGKRGSNEKSLGDLVMALLCWSSQAQAQQNFSAGVAMTSTFAGIGLGIDLGFGNRSDGQVVRFGAWVQRSKSSPANHCLWCEWQSGDH